MASKLKQILLYFFISIISIAAIFFFLIFLGIIWRSPAYYSVAAAVNPEVPIISMEAYGDLAGHRRPYIYMIENQKGSVYVVGIDHTKDEKDPQIDSLRIIWKEYQPDIALVEGRMGFLFSWFQDPVEQYGESGETVRLAKKNEVPYYTWEPDKESEINYLLNHYSAKQLALFYSVRPYFSNYRFGKPGDPEKTMNSYISSRTDYDQLRGLIKDYNEIDSIWNADFPNEKDWRETTDEYGWPEGYLAEIAAMSNQVRDIHMCSVILDLVENGNKVFVTMGSSHAFRIEPALRHEMQRIAATP